MRNNIKPIHKSKETAYQVAVELIVGIESLSTTGTLFGTQQNSYNIIDSNEMYKKAALLESEQNIIHAIFKKKNTKQYTIRSIIRSESAVNNCIR